MLTSVAATGTLPVTPFLVMAFGFVFATFGHIIKSRLVVVVGLAVIAGVSGYVLYVVRPR